VAAPTRRSPMAMQTAEGGVSGRVLPRRPAAVPVGPGARLPGGFPVCLFSAGGAALDRTTKASSRRPFPGSSRPSRRRPGHFRSRQAPPAFGGMRRTDGWCPGDGHRFPPTGRPAAAGSGRAGTEKVLAPLRQDAPRQRNGR
jgi:hypothetical protein